MNAFNFPVRMPGASLQSDARERALDLRELRYFCSVARIGNIGRAARELNISQPALSQQMRKLEEGLGTQLLVRHGRGVMLTPAGCCLRDRLDTIMQLLAAPLDRSAPVVTQSAGLSLAVPAECASLLVAPLVRRFRARWPNLALDIREGSNSDIEEWVLNRRVNLAIAQDPPGVADIEVAPVLSESLGLVASVRSHLAADPRPLRLRDAVGEPLILPGNPHWIRRRLESAARQNDLRLEPLLQVNSLASTKAMVRNGLGFTILPLTSVHDEVERSALAFRTICHPELFSVCAIVSRRDALDGIVADFAAIARDVMTTLVDDGVWPGARAIRSSRQPPVLPVDARSSGMKPADPPLRSAVI